MDQVHGSQGVVSPYGGGSEGPMSSSPSVSPSPPVSPLVSLRTPPSSVDPEPISEPEVYQGVDDYVAGVSGDTVEEGEAEVPSIPETEATSLPSPSQSPRDPTRPSTPESEVDTTPYSEDGSEGRPEASPGNETDIESEHLGVECVQEGSHIPSPVPSPRVPSHPSVPESEDDAANYVEEDDDEVSEQLVTAVKEEETLEALPSEARHESSPTPSPRVLAHPTDPKPTEVAVEDGEAFEEEEEMVEEEEGIAEEEEVMVEEEQDLGRELEAKKELLSSLYAEVQDLQYQKLSSPPTSARNSRNSSLAGTSSSLGRSGGMVKQKQRPHIPSLALPSISPVMKRPGSVSQNHVSSARHRETDGLSMSLSGTPRGVGFSATTSGGGLSAAALFENVTELDQQVRDRERELADFQEKVDTLTTLLDDRGRENRALQAKVKELGRDNADLRATKRTLLLDAEDNPQGRQGAATIGQQMMAAAGGKPGDKQQNYFFHLTRLEDAVEEKNSTIISLRKQVRTLGDTVHRHEITIGEQAATIEELENPDLDHVAAYESKIAELARAVAELDAENVTLADINRMKTNAIRDLTLEALRHAQDAELVAHLRDTVEAVRAQQARALSEVDALVAENDRLANALRVEDNDDTPVSLESWLGERKVLRHNIKRLREQVSREGRSREAAEKAAAMAKIRSIRVLDARKLMAESTSRESNRASRQKVRGERNKSETPPPTGYPAAALDALVSQIKILKLRLSESEGALDAKDDALMEAMRSADTANHNLQLEKERSAAVKEKQKKLMRATAAVPHPVESQAPHPAAENHPSMTMNSASSRTISRRPISGRIPAVGSPRVSRTPLSSRRPPSGAPSGGSRIPRSPQTPQTPIPGSPKVNGTPRSSGPGTTRKRLPRAVGSGSPVISRAGTPTTRISSIPRRSSSFGSSSRF